MAVVLNILANVAFGTATVFHYAYLPLLTDAHPKVRSTKATIETELYVLDVTRHGSGAVGALGAPRNDDESKNPKISDQLQDVSLVTPLDGDSAGKKLALARLEATHRLHGVRDEVGNELSTHAFAISYTGGVIVMAILCAVIFGTGSNSTYLLQMFVAGVGVWWLVFALGFTMPCLKSRPGPPLPKNERSYFLFSWKKNFNTFRHAAQLKQTFLFLMSWFVYADGYSTIATVAVLFGKSSLNMTSLQLAVIAGATPLLAVMGNYFFLFVFHRWLKFSTKSIVMILLVLMVLIPIYGLLGFFIPDSVPLGVKTVEEMYIVGLYYGFLVGALQSFSRVLFSGLIPPGKFGRLLVGGGRWGEIEFICLGYCRCGKSVLLLVRDCRSWFLVGGSTFGRRDGAILWQYSLWFRGVGGIAGDRVAHPVLCRSGTRQGRCP